MKHPMHLLRTPALTYRPPRCFISRACHQGITQLAGMAKLRRRFVHDTSQTTSQLPLHRKFKVLQWNILADGLAESGGFLHKQKDGSFLPAPEACLLWKDRAPMIIEEIQESEADLVCLQELNHYDELKAQLTAMGYAATGFHGKGCAVKLGGRSCPVDGTAIFYKESRFTPVDENCGYYIDRATNQPFNQGYQYVELHDKLAGINIRLFTTHLKAKAEYESMRCQQAEQLLKVVKQLENSTSSSKHSNGNGNGNGKPVAAKQPVPVAVLVAGDFNTEPSSNVCQQMREHNFNCLWDVPHSSHASCPDARNGNGHLSSQPGSQVGGEHHTESPAEYSTWKYRKHPETGVVTEYKRIIDYIWYADNGLVRPVNRWAALSSEEVGGTALPCLNYPSDHLALCCEFVYNTPVLPSTGDQQS